MDLMLLASHPAVTGYGVRSWKAVEGASAYNWAPSFGGSPGAPPLGLRGLDLLSCRGADGACLSPGLCRDALTEVSRG
jgi:hypothetical protein